MAVTSSLTWSRGGRERVARHLVRWVNDLEDRKTCGCAQVEGCDM